MFGMQHANHFVFRNRQQSCGCDCDRGSYPNGQTCYVSLTKKSHLVQGVPRLPLCRPDLQRTTSRPPSLDIQHKLCSLLTLPRIALPRELLPPAIRTDLVFTP